MFLRNSVLQSQSLICLRRPTFRLKKFFFCHSIYFLSALQTQQGLLKYANSTNSNTSKGVITQADLDKNNGEEGRPLWVLIHGKVYDMTTFKHPGGRDILLEEHGLDRGDEFDSIHSPAAREEMKKHCIGELYQEIKEGEKNVKKHKKTDGDSTQQGGSQAMYLIPLLIIFVIGALVYLKTQN